MMTSPYTLMSSCDISYREVVSRWEPDASGRMVAAALDLYETQGYESTTIADIAARAGVTERTFFRHFSDKREVLFAGAKDLETRVLEEIAVMDEAPLLDMATAAYVRVAIVFESRRDFLSRRARVIAGNPNLRERELLKTSSLSAALSRGMVARGVPATTAAIAAECATVAFVTAFDRWLTDPGDTGLVQLIAGVATELKSVAANSSPEHAARNSNPGSEQEPAAAAD
ncbi:TetR family transcriptional regulator [Amycolatopsis rhizosphaerae]|uniref:TetR family transcriptional regulator n=1 Tax=Amycolatopsis rhizosphaerae TaxID=2053003 RepID=A0A558DIV5_9PSEU|nr:TetR family transcriptional regulator [Amycolatopsis rhizosphaerae]